MFRFTIRDMLWLTVVAALGAGWWMHARALEARRMADFRKWMAHHREVVFEAEDEIMKLEKERDALSQKAAPPMK